MPWISLACVAASMYMAGLRSSGAALGLWMVTIHIWPPAPAWPMLFRVTHETPAISAAPWGSSSCSRTGR